MRWLTNWDFQKFKIGHAGTLDPGYGLLLVCTGKFTKRITELQAKEYTGTFHWSYTPSYDLETEIDETFPTSHRRVLNPRNRVKQF
jgi:tRNA pseudouridine55 synthase